MEFPPQRSPLAFTSWLSYSAKLFIDFYLMLFLITCYFFHCCFAFIPPPHFKLLCERLALQGKVETE